MKIRHLFGRSDGDDGGPAPEPAGTAPAPGPSTLPTEPPVAPPSVDVAAEVAGERVEPPDGGAPAFPPSPPVAVDPGPTPDVRGEPGGWSPLDGEAGDGEDEDAGGQIAFELTDWGARERKLLEDQLGALRIARAWEAGTLVVDRSDADAVDDLIDEIDERIALDLGPDVVPVVYGVKGWPQGLEDRFIEALIEARIPHQRGYQEIAVGADDEERVDALVEEIQETWDDEQAAGHAVDGPDAQEVLSELFVGADRLLHDPSDRPGAVRFDDAASLRAEMAVPFGFATADWEQVGEHVEVLRALLGDAEAGDEAIVAAATDLRNLLRPLV